MVWKAVLLFGLAVGGQADVIAHSEQKLRKGYLSELNPVSYHNPENYEEYALKYPSYEFSYSVSDPHTHDYKGQYEIRHGDEVTGEYWLVQPDGKKRTVTYQANKLQGFRAQVHYTDVHHHEGPKHVEKEVHEKQPEEHREEKLAENNGEKQEKPTAKHSEHKPIHIEYYINPKYYKTHHQKP